MGRRDKIRNYITCDLCHVRLNISAWNQHIQGKKHNESLAHQNVFKSTVRRSLFITGFPTTTSKFELLDYFSKFASVADVFMDKTANKYAIIELNDMVDADRIFCRKHKFNNHWLTIKRRSPKQRDNKFAKSKVNEYKTADMTLVQQYLNSAANFEEQISCLVPIVTMSDAELNKKMEVCKQIETMMKQFFPNCQAVPYGSNVSGLGAKGCDLDIFLDLNISQDPLDYINEEEELRILASLRNDLKHVRNLSNDQFLKKVQSLDPRRVVQLISSITKKYFPGCRNVIPIKSARCPIVTFNMPELGFDCDLSILSGIGVHNSVLIGFYCKLDERVLHVLCSVRLWAKFAGICDSRNGYFSSYAITMLGIFYLQNCEPPVLPTVETLQSLQDLKVFCKEWECHFCMDKAKIPQQFNMESAGQLLIGFFRFYFQHSLSDSVVCLRSGKFVSKEEFMSQILKDERLSDFKMKNFNIQDPFELNYNLATNLQEQANGEWISAISKAYSLLSDPSEFEKQDDDQLWGLTKLLFKFLKIKQTDDQKRHNNVENGHQSSVMSSSASSSTESFPGSTINSAQKPNPILLDDTPEIVQIKTNGHNSSVLLTERQNHIEVIDTYETMALYNADSNEVVDSDKNSDKIPDSDKTAKSDEMMDSNKLSESDVIVDVDIVTKSDKIIGLDTTLQSSVVATSDETTALVDSNLKKSNNEIKNNTDLNDNNEIKNNTDLNETTAQENTKEATSSIDNVESSTINKKAPLLPIPKATPLLPTPQGRQAEDVRFHPYKRIRSLLDDDFPMFSPNFPSRKPQFQSQRDYFEPCRSRAIPPRPNFRSRCDYIEPCRSKSNLPDDYFESCRPNFHPSREFFEPYRPNFPSSRECFEPWRPNFFSQQPRNDCYLNPSRSNVSHHWDNQKWDDSPSMTQSQRRVTPSKPRKSHITAITEYFEIITCDNINTCNRHPKTVEQNNDENESSFPQVQLCSQWSYEIMAKILSVALRLDCELLTDLNETVTSKMPHLILCKAFHNTWVDRNAARASVTSVNSDPIVSEGEISDYLIKTYPPLAKDPLFICHCLLVSTDHDNQTILKVTLDLISTMNKEFVNFSIFLKSLAQKIFTKLTTSNDSVN